MRLISTIAALAVAAVSHAQAAIVTFEASGPDLNFIATVDVGPDRNSSPIVGNNFLDVLSAQLTADGMTMPLDPSLDGSSFVFNSSTGQADIFNIAIDLGGKVLFGKASVALRLSFDEIDRTTDDLFVNSIIGHNTGVATLFFVDNTEQSFELTNIDLADFAPVPVPGALGLMLAGLGSFGVFRRRAAV